MEQIRKILNNIFVFIVACLIIIGCALLGFIVLFILLKFYEAVGPLYKSYEFIHFMQWVASIIIGFLGGIVGINFAKDFFNNNKK